MYTQMVIVGLLVALASAAPSFVAPAPVVRTVPAPFVTAHSTQVVARNHNGVVAPLVPAAPIAAYAAPALPPLPLGATLTHVHPFGTGVAPYFSPFAPGLVL